MKRIIVAILLLTLLLTLMFSAAGCGPGTSGNGKVPGSTGAGQTSPPPPSDSAGMTTPEPTQPTQSTQPTQTQPPKTSPAEEKPRPETLEEQMESTIKATITMADGGIIEIELFPDLAPQSVRNFVYLARKGFYDGLKFHRIMKDFMIQGGCPDGTGTGNPGYSIKGEFTENGFVNDLSHKRGVLSMARANDPDSAGSQFFIVHGNSEFLDGKYAAFGRVVNGMDVVDKIAKTPNNGPNGSVESSKMPVIKSITIDDDIELPEPNKLSR